LLYLFLRKDLAIFYHLTIVTLAFTDTCFAVCSFVIGDGDGRKSLSTRGAAKIKGFMARNIYSCRREFMARKSAHT